MKSRNLIIYITLLCCSAGLADTHYVDINNTAPSAPYTSWATAATNIQDAVDSASSDDTVLVNDGVYDSGTRVSPVDESMNRVVITNEISLQSVNGPNVTVITGAPDPGTGGSGANAVRGVYMSSGTLSGFTITDGHTTKRGGGIWISSDLSGHYGIVSNCVLAGNSAHTGGGSYGGKLNNCTLNGNTASDAGGGSYDGILSNCTLSGNTSDGGGGIAYCIAFGCLLKDNAANTGGGGSGWGRLNYCTLVGNTAGEYGGGSYYGTLNNCTLIGNSAELGGGYYSRFYGKLNSCMLMANSAGSSGGGIWFGIGYSQDKNIANNCTIVENTAYRSAGGMSGGIANNCIVWDNHATLNPDLPNLLNTETYYTCLPYGQHGVDGNSTNAPIFADPEKDDYRLLATSPCIDAGSNAYVTNSTDLDGNTRTVDGDLDGTATVDMGAYEFQVMMIPADCIDIPPVNLKSKGRIPVTILTTDDFDAAVINPQSVSLAGALPVHSTLRDTGLRLHFKTADLTMDSGAGEVALMAQTHDGVYMVGMASVKMLPGK